MYHLFTQGEYHYSATGLLDTLLSHCIATHVSDVHMEPMAFGIRVRVRVHGQLVLYDIFESEIARALINRIKVFSGMDTSCTHMPQDGAVRLQYEHLLVDVRVATFPTNGGEKLVLRLLHHADAASTLHTLGLPDTIRDTCQTICEQQSGFFVVCGPTGSGKTTTLYALLQSVRRSQRNVVTLEDPIEYRLSGVTQSLVRQEGDFTFARALRSLLRQDPDVIMIGEMRDRATAQVALEASLTGHLVFSSLHTSSAPAALLRFLEMGNDPSMIASCLSGVIGQRLVPRNCNACVRTVALSAQQKSWCDALHWNLATYAHSVGCQACSYTGYSGRVVLAELLLAHKDAMDVVLQKDITLSSLIKMACNAGMKPMSHSAYDYVEKGYVSLPDIMRLGIPYIPRDFS